MSMSVLLQESVNDNITTTWYILTQSKQKKNNNKKITKQKSYYNVEGKLLKTFFTIFSLLNLDIHLLFIENAECAVED